MRFSPKIFQSPILNYPGNDVVAHRLVPVDISGYFDIILDGMQNNGKYKELQLQLRTMFTERKVL